MEGTARIWFTPQQRAELWERWKNGQCVADIARALERRNKSGVYRILAVNGGIAPEPRRRAAGALRLEEREEISRGIAAGRSIQRIALGLRRSPSTVPESGRSAGVMVAAAPTARARPIGTPGSGRCARSFVAWLATRGYDGGSRRSSRTAVVAGADRRLAGLAATPCRPRHADIARNDLLEDLFIQTRGVLKKQLMAHLRTARQMRQAKGGNTKSGLGQIVDTVSIRERPAEAKDRAVPESLGRRSSHRDEQLAHRDSRRAPYPL